MKTASLVLICLLLVIPCQARTITVDDDGPADFNNIQAAINDANNGDTITVGAGTYTENISFGGKNIVLTSTDSNNEAVVAGTVIDANGSGHVVTFSGSEDTNCILIGFTITGGYASGDSLHNSGGGIMGNGTMATISKCIIRDNICEGRGGGVYWCNGLISRCLITKNSAWLISQGGGLASCSGTIIDCTVHDNVAGFGAGMYSCNGDIVNCIISGNVAIGLGAIYAGGSPNITNCTVSRNIGDGVVSRYASHPKIRNSIIWDNSEGDIDTDCGLKSAGYVTVSYSVLQSDWKSNQCVTVHNNMVADPCFVNPGQWDNNGTPDDPWDDFLVAYDCHLQSQAGRWNPNTESWVTDANTSVAIDAGDPANPIGFEPFPNGGIINMGAYGGTAEASKSYFGTPPCETVVAGDINGDCIVNFKDFALMVLHWLEDNNP